MLISLQYCIQLNKISILFVGISVTQMYLSKFITSSLNCEIFSLNLRFLLSYCYLYKLMNHDVYTTVVSNLGYDWFCQNVSSILIVVWNIL